MLNINKRLGIIYFVIFAAMTAIILRVFYMQIIRGSEYDKIAGSRIGVNLIDKAPRGEITDRYGERLVTNKACYSLALTKTNVTDDQLNGVILKTLLLLDTDIQSTLPIDENMNFTFSDDNEKKEWFESDKYKKYVNSSMTAQEAFDALCEKLYKISGEYSLSDRYKILSVRYEADKHGFSPVSPYVLADDVSMEAIAEIKESADSFPGIVITNSYKRKYENGGYLSHVLGRVGKMNDAEYEKYKSLGYSYSDSVGKQGVEKEAEQYLRGTDGVKGSGGDDGGIINKTPMVPGDNVVLTIDMDLQRTLEDSLKKRILKISREGGEKTGKDANAGAAVVVDVKNGDILACASYPTYDLAEFSSSYSTLSNDKNRPLLNRAASGTYTPGSTFKPLVAVAAMESGKLKPNEKITDEGIYKFYEDYRPRCWIWSEYHTTHGSINVSQAIEKSCNYFFYETGRRCGIDILDSYARSFGLGQLTGSGLPEEVSGYIAGPESKKKLVKNVDEQGWYGADTLQASIGQSIHAFTPLQIADYISTIANGGTCYKLNLIKSVRSASDGSLVYESRPEARSSVKMSSQTLEAVKVGMKNVVDEGSARAIFTGYPIEIGGKTGTAQLGKKSSNNALFAAFAPYDDPQIAVCVVLEHGVRGTNAAYVAKDLFDEYFGLNEEAVSAFNEENNLNE